MDLNIKHKFWALFFVIAIAWSNGLKADDNLAIIKEKYHDEIAVFLNYNETITIDVLGDSLNIKSEIFKEMLHLDEKSKIFADNNVYSNHFIDIKNLEASTLVPLKKNKYREFKVEEFKESFDKNSSVFFDDGHNYNFTYPAIQTGAKTILKYEERYLDPHMLTRFYFSTYIPIIHRKVIFKINKNVKMKFDLINNDSSVIEQSKSVNGDYVIYKFQASDVPKYVDEPHSPNISFYEPHLLCGIESYKTSSNTTKNVLSSTRDLFDWYMTFIDDIPASDNAALKNVVNQLINDNMTELEKVKVIFYWVQDNIKYIAFEDGMRGFVPHNGNYVCEKRYGDCKDMSSILIDMLAAAGVEAHYTWIGTRDIPYSYKEIFSPVVDNHMIATYFHDGKPYFLDATAQYVSLGQPSSMIQGKEALIAIDKNNFLIEKIPVISENQNVLYDSCHFKLDGNNLLGNGTLTLSGYNKMFSSFSLIRSNAKKVEDYVEALLKKGNNKFFVDDYKILNLDNRDLPLVIKYSIRIEDYAKQAGKKIYLNLNVDKSLADELIDIEQRKLPVESEFKLQYVFKHDFEVPKGYQVEYLPENSSFTNELVSFDLNYHKNQNSVETFKSISQKYLIVNKQQFNTWNETVKSINSAYRDSAIFSMP